MLKYFFFPFNFFFVFVFSMVIMKYYWGGTRPEGLKGRNQPADFMLNGSIDIQCDSNEKNLFSEMVG